MDTIAPRGTVGWHSIRRGQKRRPMEWLAEKAIFAISLSAIIMVFLIFVFVLREGLPVIIGKTDSALLQEAMSLDAMEKLPPDKLQAYLELTPQQYAELSQDNEAMRA